MNSPLPSPPSALSRKRLTWVVIALWSIVMLAIFIRVGFSPHRNTVFETYETAGKHWIASQDIYKTKRGFVYSPLIAAFFAPFTVLPDLASNVLWRLLNLGVYLGAICLWLKLELHHRIPKSRHILVYLLLLPLSLGNFNNGQANPIIIGLLMLAVIGTKTTCWNTAALCVAVAAYFKIYPLVVGMLLIVLFPQKLSWRLPLAVIVLGGLSFLLQKPAYVTHQYQLWIATRMGDDRRQYVQVIAPNDLWLLLRYLHISITEKANIVLHVASGTAIAALCLFGWFRGWALNRLLAALFTLVIYWMLLLGPATESSTYRERAYIVLQVSSGAAIAAICFFGRLKGWALNRLLASLFTLVVCWMLLLGPATESSTYILLAPALVLALLQAFNQPMSPWLRVLPVSTYLITLVSLGIDSFTPFNKDIHAMALQPAGALIFSCYVVIWVLTPAYWPGHQPSYNNCFQ